MHVGWAPSFVGAKPKYIYQRSRVTTHKVVCKMVNPGINDAFTETLKTKEIAAIDLPKNLARTKYESKQGPFGVPWTYFRVSLRDCASHSSRWVDFADFGLVGFCFFVRLVNILRAFVDETTARSRFFGHSLS
jgi:hypothetical protein